MNLTVDQMDVLNFRLTEVSLELLGNKFYDIFGQKCDTLGSLYRSKSGQTNNDFAADSDLVAALQLEDIFSGYDGPSEQCLGGNLGNDNRIIDENVGSSSDSDESDDNAGCGDSNREQDRSTELKITKMINDVEEGKMIFWLYQSSKVVLLINFFFCRFRIYQTVNVLRKHKNEILHHQQT